MTNFSRLLLFFLLSTAFTVCGQSSFVFHHLSTNEGLSNNHVKSVLKDSQGFLWIGTESGLNRYDGYRFKNYLNNPASPNTLIGDDIWSLQEDKSGNVWIGSENGYMVYNREKDSFTSDLGMVLKEKGIDVARIEKVYIDQSGDLWVLSESVFYYYQFQSAKLKRVELPLREAFSICDDGTNIYILSYSGEMLKLEIKNGKLENITVPAEVSQKIKDKGCNIYLDKTNGLWVFSELNNLVCFNTQNQSWENIPNQTFAGTEGKLISSVIDDGHGKIWIATDQKELIIYDKLNGKATKLEHDPWIRSSLLSSSIVVLYQDDMGAIWLGCHEGLSCYHDAFQRFFNFRNADFSDVSAVMEDKEGNVWLGTDGFGLVCKKGNRDGDYQRYAIPGNVVVSLCDDSKGRIWVGTYQNGLLCYDNGRIKQITKENSGLADNSVWSIVEDRYGYIWVGTLWGTLQRFNPERNEFEKLLADNTRNLTVMDLFYDGGDKLFVGTVSGLCEVDIKTGQTFVRTENFKKNQRFQQSFVQSLYRDERNILWIGHNQGLTAWDLTNDTMYYFNKRNGLCDNVVRGIKEDALHQIWITTSNGCSVISVEQQVNGSYTFGCDNFTVKDGLMDNNFNRQAIWSMKSGDIILGGTEGYTLVDPFKMKDKKQPLAKVTFTGLKIANKEISVDSLYNGRMLLEAPLGDQSELKLHYSDILITIDYSTMDLLTADKVRYAYKLEGLNNQWIYTSENEISFTTLPSGEYTLWVKACNSDGVWNDEPTKLRIVVQPPFWMSKVAYAIYILLLLGIGFVWRKSLQKKHSLKLEQQRLQLEREQMVRINEMKLNFFTNISHDFRTPLTLIMTPLQVIMQELNNEAVVKKLKAVYRSAEQLLELVNELLDFRKMDVGAENTRLTPGEFVSFIKDIATTFNMYATNRQMDFSVESEIETVNTLFDVDKVRKIMTNLLSNAFKFTPDKGQISVRIFVSGSSVGVCITDSGIGITDENKKHVFERFYQASHEQDKTGSGIGLHIANEYVRMHSGTINVEDNTPNGSKFIFTIPIVVPETKIENLHLEQDEIDDEWEDEEEIVEVVQRPVLLFVDDNKEFCAFMSESLSDDFTVLQAGNGKEALSCLADHDVDVVVSDVMMPVMDGMELCKRIKTNINWSHIPVILLTARTAEEFKIKSLEMGADDYITKPFNFNMLKLRIRKFMEWTEKCHMAFSQKIDINPSEITITSLDEQLIAKAIKVVEDHISDSELSVETLSSAVGLTRGHLYKKLKSITGRGPMEFIRTIRLKRAKQLLEESQLQVSEIAYAVGFNYPKIFTRNFRSEFGISPSEYLKNRK